MAGKHPVLGCCVASGIQIGDVEGRPAVLVPIYHSAHLWKMKQMLVMLENSSVRSALRAKVGHG